MTQAIDKSNEIAKARGRPALGDEARTALINATSSILVQKGSGGLTARAVASRAGVAVGTIYKYFDDLPELVRHVNAATYDAIHADQSKIVANAAAKGGGVYEQLMAMARGYIAFVEAHQHEWASTLAFNAQQDAAPQWYRVKEASLMGIVEGVLQPLPKLKSRQERLQVAMALWASVHGIVVITMAGGFQDSGADQALAQIAIVVEPVVRSFE